ncbi:hypothetical protein MMC32_004470 [Xylographa parallela]|nr:hypothetical protein [Xylographa parallela]
MRLPLVFTAALVFGPPAAQTRSSSPRSVERSRVVLSGVKAKILSLDDHLDERQSSSNSEHKDIGNVPHPFEARAALPMLPLPPRMSFSDGFYQPIICSSRFGTHITVPGCLHLIYDQGLNAMDQIRFCSGSDPGPGVRLPYSINHFINPDMPFAVITRTSVPLRYPMIEQGQNIQMLLFRMMLHCVVNSGGVGGQAMLLSGVTVTLYGGENTSDEHSDPSDDESDLGDPADRFPTFVPGARAHTGSRQGIMPMQGGY